MTKETMALLNTKTQRLLTVTCLLLGQLPLAQSQMAVNSPSPSAQEAEPASVLQSVASDAQQPASPKSTLSERQVPRMTLRWDCGDCEHNEKVFPLIEKTYADKAAAKGYAVSDAETAEIVVTKYRQRPPATRVLFGFMAGKDILETRVTFRGTDFSAGDYSANAMQGMNFLCETVAQQTLDKLLVSLQSPAKPVANQ